MGMLDHKREWRFDVQASPNECVNAFTAVFTGSGGLLIKARWRVNRTRTGAVAIYEGRRGIGMIGRLSQRASLEEDTAVGSEVRFDVEPNGGERTVCSMWLASSGRAGIGGLLGATSDSRFIRPYMRGVVTQLRQIDPGLEVAKGLFGAELETQAPAGPGPRAAAPPTAEEVAAKKATWAAAVDVGEGELWTCPECGYAKNPGGRVRCAQCRREIGRA